MAKVAREMVEKAGVNVDQLVELLVKNAAAELTTYYYNAMGTNDHTLTFNNCIKLPPKNGRQSGRV